MQRQSGRNVLVVDDDEESREILVRFLELEGFAVGHAADGDAALAWLQAHSAPQAILLDLNMPNLNGWEFSQELRRDPATRDVPLIVFSAGTDVHRDARELGAYAWLDKPVDFDCLLTALRKTCT